MKTKFTPATPDPASEYPFVGYHSMGYRLVYFYAANCGVVLQADSRSMYRPGHYSTTWGMQFYKKAEGVLEITCP